MRDKTSKLKGTSIKFRKSLTYTELLNCTQKITSAYICQIEWDAVSQDSFGKKQISFKNFTR